MDPSQRLEQRTDAGSRQRGAPRPHASPRLSSAPRPPTAVRRPLPLMMTNFLRLGQYPVPAYVTFQQKSLPLATPLSGYFLLVSFGVCPPPSAVK